MLQRAIAASKLTNTALIAKMLVALALRARRSAGPRCCATPELSGGYDALMMDDLVERAKFEAALLARATPELQALAAPTVAELTPAEDGATARVSGKGAKSKPAAAKKKKSKGRGGAKPPSLKALSALALSQEGVVRLDGVLQASTAASLRAEILERRAAAFAAVESGEDWRLYFADVLLKADRCDLLMPLKGNRGMQMALRELLVGSRAAGDGGGGGGGGGASTTLLHGVLGSTLGDDATLYAMWI